MELIYSMRRKPLKCEPPHFDNSLDAETVRPICTVSVLNIIAFSSPTELSDVDGDTWGGHVYVCDLDTPWNAYKVASTSHPVSALEWDLEGKQLLLATSVGEVSVWGQRDYLLNDWQCLYTASFPGEHILKAAFFHPGRRVVMLDKKPEAPITERVQVLRSTPTLKGFGGVAVQGLVVVTASGLVGAALRSGAPAATEALRPSRDRVTAASIAYKSGSMLIACICVRGGASCVRVFLAALSGAPLLALRALPAVHRATAGIPLSVSWLLREDTDSLLVAGSSLTLWKWTERANPVHKLLAKGPLQGSTTPGGGPKPGSDTFNTVVWQKAAVWPLEGEPGVSIARGRGAGGAGLAVATPRALLLPPAHPHQPLCSRQVVTSGTPGPAAEAPAAGASPPKKPKYGPGVLPAGAAHATVSHVDTSALAGCVVCVDTHAQLHVYRAHDTPAAHTLSLLEYSLVSGHDCVDILLALKPNVIEPLYDRLSESFSRQPPAFQQYYYHAALKLKAALCRLSPALQSNASSLASAQMCCAVLASAGAALRGERGDAPALDDDDEKSLVALEAKPEQLAEGAGGAALAALRRGLQRARDVALSLAAAPPPDHAPAPPRNDTWSDPVALGALRRLVVAWRAAARGGDALSRLLARLPHARPDLLDECAALGLQAGAPRAWECPPRCAVSAPHGRPAPLYFEYGVEPEFLRYTPEPPASAQYDNVPPLAMDSIRYMYLGGGAACARWRACTRCGVRALPHAHAHRHPLQRAYDARFLPACRCGGSWYLCKNT